MKLCISEEGKNSVNELEEIHPSLKEYHDMVAKEIGCTFEEAVCLFVHPDKEEEDEEGWQVESFFPKGVELKTEIINDDYHTSDFSIGSVVRLIHDGVVFVAETNASPWLVYANPNKIEIGEIW